MIETQPYIPPICKYSIDITSESNECDIPYTLCKKYNEYTRTKSPIKELKKISDMARLSTCKNISSQGTRSQPIFSPACASATCGSTRMPDASRRKNLNVKVVNFTLMSLSSFSCLQGNVIQNTMENVGPVFHTTKLQYKK